MNCKEHFRKIINWPALPALLLLVVFYLINIISRPSTFSIPFVKGFLSSNVALICVALGSMAPLLTGGADISLGPLVSFINVLMVTLIGNGTHPVIAIAVCVIIAILCGMLNGLIVAVLRINPLLTTFATSTIFSGFALITMPFPGGNVGTKVTSFFSSTPMGIPMPVFVIAIPIIIWEIFRRTPAGLRIYAVGFNEAKAYASGINVIGQKIFAYTFSGFSAGLGAIAFTGYIGAGDPLIGATLSMTGISAAVIGGVALSGGRGNIWGPLFGCMFLGLLIMMVVSLQVNSFMQDLLSAIILFISILGAIVLEKREFLFKSIFNKGQYENG